VCCCGVVFLGWGVVAEVFGWGEWGGCVWVGVLFSSVDVGLVWVVVWCVSWGCVGAIDWVWGFWCGVWVVLVS